MTRETVDAKDVIYEFTPDLEASTTVADGASLTVKTRDSLEGTIQTDDLLDEYPRK